MESEIGVKANLDVIRYAQCWEDADILLEALDIQPHHVCLSIASAGDNTLAMLSRGPRKVIALDLSSAQVACLELRVAAYRTLEHSELLELLGARPSVDRAALYQRCRPFLSAQAQRFWDTSPAGIAQGFGNIGRFERYLKLFGTRILPLLESKRARRRLLEPCTQAEREQFYTAVWDNWRWRSAFRLFFSRRIMARLGRDKRFFTYVESSVGERLLARTRYALTILDPTQNPYLQWILLGHYGPALPHALRPENFNTIRDNLDRIEWHCQSLENYLSTCPNGLIHGFNLSDAFEYMSLENYHKVLEQLIRCGLSGGRVVYWNMQVARHRPDFMAERLRPLTDLAANLYRQDKAFFYRDFVIEEII